MNAPPTPQPRGFAGPGSSLRANPRRGRWLRFGADGVVHVHTGKAELGQGILTALQVLVADELDVALDRVQVIAASTAHGPDEGVTSGSLSVQDSGGALRQVCAEVRALALRRAAAKAGVAVEPLQVRDGHVRTPQGESLGDYAALIDAADLDADCTGTVAPKPAAQRRLTGRVQAPRIDLADKVFGRPRFIHDLRLPGLLHGRVVRPPMPNATLAAAPDAAFAGLPDGVQAWADGRFIAVVASSERAAERAAERVRARLAWLPGPPLPDANDLDAFLQSAPHETTLTHEHGASGDAATWPPGGSRHSAVYLKPYLAHASIGPSCALARWGDGTLEVWTHSQGIHNLRDDLVRALAGEPSAPAQQDITVHHVEGAGCYGHNGADDVAFDAVLMALRCPGRPVRALWSRADELTHSPFGSAQRVRIDARLDDAGRITHWQHTIHANGYSSRPGRAAVPALLAASERAHASALPLPINPPLAAGGGAERNAVPGYALPHVRVVTHRLTVAPLRTSAMRALGGYANVFALESFMDELARARGEDPLAFRKRHLDDPRALAVLKTVVERSTWWADAAGTEGLGRGLAWARYKNSGAWCAVVARVEVGTTVRVTHLDLAVDVGMVVDLDGVINQIEGGAIQATSWTVKEQVGFDRAAITSVDWPGYPVLRFSEVPEVRVHVLDRPDEPPLGAGEAAQGPVAAAIGNAVHDALGVRARTLPLNPDNLLRAIHA